MLEYETGNNSFSTSFSEHWLFVYALFNFIEQWCQEKLHHLSLFLEHKKFISKKTCLCNVCIDNFGRADDNLEYFELLKKGFSITEHAKDKIDIDWCICQELGKDSGDINWKLFYTLKILNYFKHLPEIDR